MTKTYSIDVQGKIVKLWQADDGSWGADAGIDPAGFTYDPNVPEANRVYELDYLVAHGVTAKDQAQDLTKQFLFLKSSAEGNNQFSQTIEQKITDGSINAQNVPLASLEEIYHSANQPVVPDAPLAVGNQKLIEQNILEVLGLKNLPFAEKKEMVELFSQTIFQAIILRIAARIPQEKRTILLNLMEQRDEEAVGAFLKDNCASLSEIALEESLKFKRFLINKSEEVDNKLQMAKIQEAATVATV